MKRLSTPVTPEKILGGLIGLARAVEDSAEGPVAGTDAVMLNGMKALLPAGCCGQEDYESLADKLLEEKKIMAPTCFACEKQCGKNNNCDPEDFKKAKPEILALKQALVQQLLALEPLMRGLDKESELYQNAMDLIYKGFFIAGKNYDSGRMAPVLEELLRCQRALIAAVV